MNKQSRLYIIPVLALLIALLAPAGAARAEDSRTFPETGKTVSGRFLQYWDGHGGLAQQGLPISDEMQEVSGTDGKTYTVQYFERAVFEKHPENAAPNDVLLALLGSFLYKQKYPDGALDQEASTSNPRKFDQTGFTVGGKFRQYWEQHGGLAQQGYPISEEFQEISDTDGNTYTVQYFERAVFELHLENAGTPSEVLLSLLGTFRLDGRGGGGVKTGPIDSASDLAVNSWTSVMVATNNVAIFYNATTGAAASALVNSDGTLKLLQGQLKFTPGWTHIVAGPQDTLFAYNAADGTCVFSKVGADGSVTTVTGYRPFSPGWTHIVIDTNTGIILFYNARNDAQQIGRIRASDGGIAALKSSPGTENLSDPRPRQFVPMANGSWFFYVGEQAIGITGTFTSAGDFITTKVSNVLSGTWSHIVSDGQFLLLYDKSKGVAATALIYPDGSFIPTHIYSEGEGGTEWTNFAAAPNGVFLLYSGETGNISTDQINDNGEVVPVSFLTQR